MRGQRLTAVVLRALDVDRAPGRRHGGAGDALEQANWLTAMDTIVWDSGWILSDTSFVGHAQHTLIGYTDQPTAMQLAVYLAILLVTFVLMRLYGSPAKATPAQARG